MKECPECLEVSLGIESTGCCSVCGYLLPSPSNAMGRRLARSGFDEVFESPTGIGQGVERQQASTQGLASSGVSALDTTPTAPPFVGREEEVARLLALLTIPRKSPGLVTISGEAGMGKSRLVEETLGKLKCPPPLAVWTCEPWGQSVAFGPVLAWIRTIARVTPGLSRDSIERHIDELAERTRGLSDGDAVYLKAALGLPNALSKLASLPDETIRRNLHRVIGCLLRDYASERRPSLSGGGSDSSDGRPYLLIDHAQWCDDATTRWLDDALEGSAAPDLTIIVLTRSPESGSDTNFGWQPKRTPDLQISLEPLTAAERGRLLDAITPTLEFLPELRRQVLERAIGTPLFIEELARLVRRVMAENAGPIRPEQVANIVEITPLSLNEIIARRLDRIDERTRNLLAVAALLGPDCSLGLLECFDQIHENLEAQMHALEGLDLLRRVEGSDGIRYRFVNGSLRDVIYNLLPAEERRRLHLRAARAIEKAHAGHLESCVDALAVHYDQAGLVEEAASYRLRAADHQSHLGEYRSAVRNYEMVLEYLDTLEPTATNQARMARIMIRLGRIVRLQGQIDRALAHLSSARSLAERLDNEFLLVHAQTEWAVTLLGQGRGGEALPLLDQLLEQSRRLGIPSAECVVLNAQGVIHWHAGRFELALQAFRGLAERARALGNGHCEADALNNTGLIYWRWGRYGEGARAFHAAAAIRMRLSDTFGLATALLNLAIMQEQLGEIPPARENYAKALRCAIETGYLQAQATLEVNLSNLERRTGLASSALDHAARGLKLARRIEEPMAEMTALENLGLANVALGRREEGERHLMEALRLAERTGAAEKEVEIGLDLLEVMSGGNSGVQESWLARIDDLIQRIETHGYRDLSSQAYRLKGRLLNQAAEGLSSEGRECLERALSFATQMQNIFEEQETLNELLRWMEKQKAEEETEQMPAKWKKRAEDIARMIASGANASQETKQTQDGPIQGGRQR